MSNDPVGTVASLVGGWLTSTVSKGVLLGAVTYWKSPKRIGEHLPLAAQPKRLEKLGRTLSQFGPNQLRAHSHQRKITHQRLAAETNYPNENNWLLTREFSDDAGTHARRVIPYVHSLDLTKRVRISARVVEPYSQRVKDMAKWSDLGGYDAFRRAMAAHRIASEKRRSQPTDNTLIAVVKVWKDGIEHTVDISKATYIDQFVTNQVQAVDLPVGVIRDSDSRIALSPKYIDRTLRSLDRSKETKLCALEDSILANTLGAAVLVVTYDGYLLLPRRNKRVHVFEDLDGCSVSGAVDWPRPQGSLENLDLTEYVFDNHLREEAVKELGVDRRTQSNWSWEPVALCREAHRAGKPQLFGIVWSSLSLSDHINAFKAATGTPGGPQSEFSYLSWIQVATSLDLSNDNLPSLIGARMGYLSAPGIRLVAESGRAFVPSDEFRACALYAACAIGSSAIKVHPSWTR